MIVSKNSKPESVGKSKKSELIQKLQDVQLLGRFVNVKTLPSDRKTETIIYLLFMQYQNRSPNSHVP